MDKIKFPKDNQAHDRVIEWWYFNGHLQDRQGNSYAYMDCLFKVKTREAGIPLLKRLPISPIYFSHSLLSDIAHKKFYSAVDYFSIISKGSFSKPLLFASYFNPLDLKNGRSLRIIEETAPGIFHLKTENLDLTLQAEKKPLLEGGTGFLLLNAKSTYYYSFTSLKTSGTVTIKGKKIKVSGQSWFDHQWADATYNQDRWTWFSLQLDNKTEIVCFEYNSKNKKIRLADFSFSDSRQFHTDRVIFKPESGSWKSPKTGADYQLSWRIEIPEQQVSLSVRPKMKNQELVFGKINYWEGPLSVSGTMGRRKVKGNGFLELVGRPSQYKSFLGLKIPRDILKSFYDD